MHKIGKVYNQSDRIQYKVTKKTFYTAVEKNTVDFNTDPAIIKYIIHAMQM